MSQVKTASTLLALSFLASELPQAAYALDDDGEDQSALDSKTGADEKTSSIIDDMDEGEEHIKPTQTTLDVNAKKNSVFTDKDNDEIEDVSPIPDELKEEEGHDDVDKHGDEMKPVGGFGKMSKFLETDDDKGDEYDEEFEENGHKFKKHVIKGDGFKSVSISSDSPMNIGELMGGLPGLLGQATMGRPGGMMMQRHAMPVIRMGPFPPPFPIFGQHSPFDHMGDPLLGDDDFEDPFDIIRQMENRRREGPFGGPRMAPMINTRPGFFPSEHHNEEHNFAQDKAHEVHGKHVHNDLDQHSPLYMFGCVMVIAAFGYFLWLHFIKGESMSDMLKQKRQRNNEDEPKEISLSRFNKRA